MLHTTAGGSSTEVVTVAGAAVGDVVVATVNTNGGTPRTIVTAKVTDDDEVTIVFSGDPAADHVVNILVSRPYHTLHRQGDLLVCLCIMSLYYHTKHMPNDGRAYEQKY